MNIQTNIWKLYLHEKDYDKYVGTFISQNWRKNKQGVSRPGLLSLICPTFWLLWIPNIFYFIFF